MYQEYSYAAVLWNFLSQLHLLREHDSDIHKTNVVSIAPEYHRQALPNLDFFLFQGRDGITGIIERISDSGGSSKGFKSASMECKSVEYGVRCSLVKYCEGICGAQCIRNQSAAVEREVLEHE